MAEAPPPKPRPRAAASSGSVDWVFDLIVLLIELLLS